jgi:O-acetyl-ADP-ribose deacetylase (regulator of RNase III)
MLTYVTGDLFESPAQTLVNTVNTVGVMGKGIALRFKQIYPEMFAKYQELCESGQFTIGQLYLWRTPNKWVLNFPTKEHWRRPSKLQYIEAGLEKFVEGYQDAGISSIAFPPLGCGNGELDFDEVRPLMERYLADLPIQIYIYPPLPRGAEVPEHKRQDEIKRWLQSEPVHLPFAEMWADLRDAIANGAELSTLTRDTQFSAEIVDVGEDEVGEEVPGVRFRTAGKTMFVARSVIRQLWSELRHHGMINSRTIGTREAAYILALLAALPYVRFVRVGNDFDHFSHSKTVGVQFVPAHRRRSPGQASLEFDSAAR